MTRIMTATEAKAKLLAVLDEVESGEEIEITRHGVTIARILPRNLVVRAGMDGTA
jgi:prevent-host-death family protein